VTGIFTLLLYLILLNYYINIELVRTIIFTSLALATLLYIFSVRILNKPLWQSNIFSNKWLIGAILVSFILQLLPLYNPFFQEFLETVPLNFNHWLIVLLGPLVVIALIEFIKIAIITPKRKASL